MSRATMVGLMLVLLAALPAAQSGAEATNVDRLADRLQLLVALSYDQWKYSTDMSADAARPELDDSAWPALKFDQRIYPDACWLRREIALPAQVLGQPLTGPVRLLLTVDDGGQVWVNGEPRGEITWSGAVELAPAAKPGQRFLVAIKAFNTGGPLRILRAELATETTRDLRRQIEDFALSLRVGQKLLGFDTYQTNATRREDPGVDHSPMDRPEKTRLNQLLQDLAARVDVAALERGDTAGFLASVADARAKLAPVAAFAKRFTLVFTANAHIDAAWLWRERETVEVCRKTFAAVLDMMDRRPDFTYTQSSAAYYDWMERLDPGLFARIRARVTDGRWEPVGGMWIEPDCNLPDGPSWARHLLYGNRYFREKLGTEVTLGWNPDSFGYSWNMPQFYRRAGIDAFITQKIGWNDTNVFPHRVFWWEAPDGSRILCYFPFDYVNEVDNPFRLVDWMRQFEANTGLDRMMVLFGVGDHGGGPSDEMLDRVDRLKALDIYPRVEYATAGTYIQWLKKQNPDRYPVWKNELYLEYHQGTFTTQARTKLDNRRSEVLLTDTEKLSTLATLSGRPYPGADLAEAWRHVLFNQFHDILPGSSIREVYVDAPERYQAAREIARHEQEGSLAAIAGQVDTSGAGEGLPVIVFNTLAWERTEPVTVALPADTTGTWAVFDDGGREVPSHIRASGRYSREVLFMADRVPSFGYATFRLKRGAPAVRGEVSATGTTLENAFLRVELDPATGWLRSVRDKRSGREVLSGPGNALQLLEDRPKAWDAWNIGWTGVEYPSILRGVEVVENGPVRAVIRVTRDFLKPGVKKDFPTQEYPSSFFTQDVILYAGRDQVDFHTEADWHEEHVMLKVAFPVAVDAPEATYEIPYGQIARSTGLGTPREKAQQEVPALRWADLSAGGAGVSLLNAGKYGYDVKANVMRLSLLRSPKYPDPVADMGRQAMDYALYPHAGHWRSAGTVRRGYELNTPLLAVVSSAHPGPLPSAHSFVRLEPAELVLTSLKQAEDGAGWVLQWYNTADEDVEAVVELPRPVARAVRSDFLEAGGEALPAGGWTVRVPTGRNAVVTVKVRLQDEPPPGK